MRRQPVLFRSLFPNLSRSSSSLRFGRALWVSAAAVLVLVFVWLISTRSASITYQPEDISYQRPLQAGHGLPSSAYSTTGTLPAGPAPSIVVSDTFHDFGRVSGQAAVEWVFVVANRGQTDLVIQRAYSTCDCTTAVLTASVIPPGQVSLVTVTYDPRIHNAPGTTVRRGLILETNDPARAQTELWVQARLP